jgi:hypothetical protein
MKLLYTLIILFAFSFAETYTIEYEKDKLFGESELIVLPNATFKGAQNDVLMFSNSRTLLGSNVISIDCSYIVKIVDNGTGVEYTKCYDFLKANRYTDAVIEASRKSYDLYEKPKLNEISFASVSLPRILGGFSIAIGSGLLINNLNKECSDCDLDEFIDFQEAKTETEKIGYTFILIGGLLIGFSE